ncbi:uncharacterized protein ACOB8E_007599 [Sarcophilus harrisii]
MVKIEWRGLEKRVRRKETEAPKVSLSSSIIIIITTSSTSIITNFIIIIIIFFSITGIITGKQSMINWHSYQKRKTMTLESNCRVKTQNIIHEIPFMVLAHTGNINYIIFFKDCIL